MQVINLVGKQPESLPLCLTIYNRIRYQRKGFVAALFWEWFNQDSHAKGFVLFS